MPSITSYSPYEKLAFFQSVARHGSSPSALQDISKILQQNEYIRDNADYDANRLSSSLLKGLYNEYVEAQDGEADGSTKALERSPKRRKLSTSDSGQDTGILVKQQQIQNLVDRLYLSYREDAVRALQKDEEAFLALQEDIKKLEQQITTEINQKSQPSPPKPTATQRKNDGLQPENRKAAPPTVLSSQSLDGQDTRLPNAQAVPADSPAKTPSIQDQKNKSPLPDDNATRPLSATPQARASQTPIPNQHPSPSGFLQQVPSSTLQRPTYGPNQTQPMYPPGQGPAGHMMSQVPSAQQRSQNRNQQPGSHGRGSPVPSYQGQHSYTAYPPYHPSPLQWHPHMAYQQQHSPYGPPPQYYPQPSNNRHPQTPQQVPYASYPHTAPVHYMQQPQQWRGQQWPVHASSATTTPILRPGSRSSMPGSGSSTPWKRRQQSSQLRTKSPSRPDRDVSPLTDHEESPGPSKASSESKNEIVKKGAEAGAVQRQSHRPGRPQSVTPSAQGPSRSQSIASRTSDVQGEKHTTSRRGQKIKAEPPTTPLPVPSSDTEQRSSGRRGRPRSSTVTSQIEGIRPTASKRKRESISPKSRTQSPQPSFTTPSSRRVDQSHDPSLVIVSRNFAKTSQLLLSEITSHKLAGIFAKPLSERDAPGYKDLVLRPQDLKAIKAAVSKGGRAALAAIEALEGDREATPTAAHPVPPLSPGSRAIGNGFYLVPKTPDLVPPKGIVNSPQLEMELMRMFANAIMFNPLPSSERGFGRGLRLRKNGGDLKSTADSEEVSTTEGSENGSVSGTDEGGIIADTREMFNDVLAIVGKWRELEGERMGTGTDTSVSRHGSLVLPSIQTTDGGRHVSISASSNVGDEDPTAGESEATSTPAPIMASGPGRKRRKVAEH